MQKATQTRVAPRLVVAAFVLLAAAPAVLGAQETQDTMKLSAQMRAARNALSAGYASLDPTKVKLLFTDSAVVLFQDEMHSGKQAVDAWVAESMTGLSAVRFGTGSFTISDAEVVERNTYVVTLSDGTTAEGTSEAVWRRQRDGSWKVVRLTVT
jgi:ketosteroid isomerase-like protein